MTAGWPQRIIQVFVVLFWGAVVAAPFVQHAAIATGHWFQLASGFAAIQAVAIAIIARQSRGVTRALGLALAAALLTVVAIRIISPEGDLPALLAASGTSHAILYSSLLLLFAQSLRPGRRSLVTTMAIRLEKGLTPAMLVYTRHVTQAWCGFFAGQLIVSALLLVFAPPEVWSLFVNVLDGPLVALMFAAEYGLRRIRFRNMRHVSPFTIIRSFSRERAVLENG
jgi:uncharacterized membrane protein